MKPKQVSVRFWEKAAVGDGCWLWTGYLNADGYGQFRLGSMMAKATRVAWLLTHGSLPNDLNVCHQCDTPSCVRPSHLFLGTQADNVKDMYAKNRNVTLRGASHGRAKLTEGMVAHIRSSPLSGLELAAQLGVSDGLISHIRLRRIWRHVP